MPTRRGDWWYYGRSFEGKQYGVQCRCPVGDPDDWTPPVLDENTEIPGEQVLLDENVEAEGHDFFALGAASVSLDANILAYSVDVTGDERYTLRFKDLRTGPAVRRPDRRHRRRRHLGGRQPHRLLHHRRRRLASRHRLAPPHRRGTARREGLPRSRRPVLARRRPHPQQLLHHHRGGQRRHLRGALRRRGRPADRVHHRAGRVASWSSTPSNTRSSAVRTAS